MSDLFDSLPGQENYLPGQADYLPTRASRRQANLAVKRRKQRRNNNIRTLLVLTLIFGGIGAAAYYGWHHLQDTVNSRFFASTADYDGPGDEPIEIVIPAGASGRSMGAILFDADVVASQQAFTQAFENNPHASGIQPGTYSLLTHMRAADAVNALISGSRVETMVTIPEGFTAEQIFDRITSQTDITQADIDEALAVPALIGLPAVASGNPEGWLFPATYRVEPSTTATQLLSEMVHRTIAELDNLGVDPSHREDILNKASLIEREARHDADRPKVARAIFNRLDADMTLDIDAAVAYGLGISGTQLTRAHLADPENLYNTYQHTGLPPTPIANPGAASIDAAVNPADGPWLFWVTVNLATGETMFSETYAEHQTYVAQLREWQAANPNFGQQTAADDPATGSEETEPTSADD